MHVPMIDIGKVRMLVRQRDVFMHMLVRATTIPTEIVRVIVMFVAVTVRMRVGDGLMRVIVLMVLGQV